MMQPVTTPQWEWRTFDPPAIAITRLVKVAERLSTSHETSFLRFSSDVDVRVGDNGLDVRSCQRIDEHGVEQWVPVLQAAFPLNAQVVRQVFLAWSRRGPANLLPSYDEVAFRSAIGADPDVMPIDVRWRRWLTVGDTCRIELAELTVRGERLRTLAISSEDRGRVWDTVVALGLAGCTPMSYVRALRQNALAVV